MIYKSKGFSLVEALLSLVIITLIFALSIPFLTKKALSFNEKLGRQSEGFYFEHSSDLDEINERCYVTYVSENDKTIIKDTGNCQKYEFIVPNRVHKIDLTLVAGGGGGGGASGGVEYNESVQTDGGERQITNNKMDYLKKLKIDALIGSGTVNNLSDASGAILSDTTPSESNPIHTGQGGNSGYAILNFDMARDFLIKIGALKEHKWYTENNSSFGAVVKTITKDETEEISAKTGYTGGLSLRFGDTSLDTYKLYKIVAPNGNVGNDSGNFCDEPDNNDNTNTYGYGIKICKFENEDDTKCDSYESIDEIRNGEGTCNTDFCTKISSALTNYSIRCKQGAEGISISDVSKDYYNAVYRGGTGGFIPNYYQTYGSGANGYDVLCNGDKCRNISNTTAQAGGQFGKITTTYQYPGHIGKGGLGGGAVILNDFPVIPGSKYTIYVGGGGKGGANGSYGKYVNGNSSETSGTQGLGGSSTAIFDENDNLVLMVIGGGGGFGGKADNHNITLNSYTYTLDTSAPKQLPIMIIGSNYRNVLLKSINKNHHGAVNNFAAFNTNSSSDDVEHPDNGATFNGNSLWRITYRYNDVGNNDEDKAYIIKPAIELLNRNDSLIYQAFILPNTTDNRISSFASYTNNINQSRIGAHNAGSFMATNLNANAYYSGFYYRYLIDDDYAFSGGLGGFSGISSKAGCGGNFVGIQQGYSMNVDGGGNIVLAETEGMSGTFLVNRAATITSSNIYRVDEYFDNCTLNTPNGQSAKFIAPVISTVSGESLGQAGSGGGGGGWSTKDGAGRGGDGQNGYVFITWKKK